MMRKIGLLMLVLVMVMVLCQNGYATEGGDAGKYVQYRSELEAYFAKMQDREILLPGQDGEGVDEPIRKSSVYVYDHSSEGGILSEYTMRGQVIRYQLELYGEMGRTQYDYYLLDGKICVYRLEMNYTAYIGTMGCEVLHSEQSVYVEDAGSWYRLDAAGERAYPVDVQNLFTIRELKLMMVDGEAVE